MYSYAWCSVERMLQSINFTKCFRDLGYTWADSTTVIIKILPDFSFGLQSVDYGTDTEDESNSIEEINKIGDKKSTTALKLSKLFSCWKK